jgi:6,7-dimethyl-8-ribityllumazine synthase
VTVYEGQLTDPGGRFAVVAARFNEPIVQSLLRGALDAFRRHGVDVESRVDVAWVPGAFEIPLVCRALADTERYAAVVALGAVIRGATPHFEAVANAVSAGVASASADTGVPVLFGVLTTDTLEQAWERAGTKGGNKGSDVALAALEMASLLRALER